MRIYKCKDVYLVIWGENEWIIPRFHLITQRLSTFFKQNNERWWLR